VATPSQAEPAATPAQPAPAPMSADSGETNPGSTQRTVGIVVGAAGVVGVGVGTIFAVSAMSKNSDSKNLCPTTTCSSAAGFQANEDAKSAATVSTIMFVAGGALLATGAVLYFTAPRR